MEPPTSHFSVSSSIQLVLCLSIADYCNSFMIYLSTIFSPIPLPTTSSSFLLPTCSPTYPVPSSSPISPPYYLPPPPLPSLHYPLVLPPLSPLYPATFLLFSHPSSLLLSPMAQVGHAAAGTFCVLSSVLEQLKVEGIVDLIFCNSQSWSTPW